MNRVELIGRLVYQPELKYTNSGLSVCSFRIAVDRYQKNEDGEYTTDFIDCVSWRQQAEFLSAYCNKGNLIAVTGSIQVRNWEAQDGSNRKTVEIVTDRVQLLEKLPKAMETPSPFYNDTDDDEDEIFNTNIDDDEEDGDFDPFEED